MPKQISLTQSQFAIVDDEDFERLNQHKWYAQYDPKMKAFYAVRDAWINRKAVRIFMHREILGIKEGSKVQVDHEKSDQTLNNCRSNIRRATRRQNICNRRKRAGCSSKFLGVSWRVIAGRKPTWVAQIQANGKGVNLGYCHEEIEAARIYDRAALRLHGKFARLNFPRSDYTNG